MIRSYAVEGQTCGEGDVRQVQLKVLTVASRKGKCSRDTSSLYWIGRADWSSSTLVVSGVALVSAWLFLT